MIAFAEPSTLREDHVDGVVGVHQLEAFAVVDAGADLLRV